MKKRLLSFILAIFLIIPCAFSLSACGKKEEENTLAGKTIYCSEFYDEFNFGHNLSLGFLDKENGWTDYRANMTVAEVLEFCLGTDAISYPNNAQPTTYEEAKELFSQKLENTFFDMAFNPHVTFSKDLKTATTYYAEGVAANTYDVEYVDNHSGQYILKSDGVEIIRFNALNSNQKEFHPSYEGNPERVNGFVIDWINFALDGECDKMVELSEYNNPNNKITKRLDEVIGDDNTLTFSLIYSVKD